MHGFAAKVLSNAGSKYGPAVSVPRKRGLAGAFQMQVPFIPPLVADLSQQESPAVAELWDVMPELMARVKHGKRFTSRKQASAAEIFHELRPLDFFQIQIDQRGGISIEADEIGRGAKLRRG
jgi:hypothetical protein